MADKNKGGRPSSYKTEYTEQAYNYCLLGATDKDLAGFFDVNVDTINEWKKKHPEFSDSLKSGKAEADAVIASKLFHKAKGYEHEDTQFATFQGQITDRETYIKHYPPDATAAIFWLKNRQPEKWRDQTHVDNKIDAKVENHNYDESQMQAITDTLTTDEKAIVQQGNDILMRAAERLKDK